MESEDPFKNHPSISNSTYNQMPPLSAKPVAVTTGAEKTVAFEQMPPKGSLVKNTPYNVQKQRNQCFEKVTNSCNSQMIRRNLQSAGNNAPDYPMHIKSQTFQ